MAVWFVRAGQQSRHAEAFVAAGVMGLGWNGIPGLGNLRGLSRDDIESALDASSLISVPGADANELLAFRDEIHIGDLIVTPDSPCREFVFGTVTGEYEYRDPSPLGDPCVVALSASHSSASASSGRTSRVHSGTERSTAADRVCAACGLLRSPGLLDASDVCADCL